MSEQLLIDEGAPVSGVRQFWRALPVGAKWLLSPIIITCIGSGLVLPFSVVYLHEVRHFPLATVGVLVAIPSIVGLLLIGPAGAAVDKRGPGRLFTATVVLIMVSEVLLASATSVPIAALALGLQGAAVSIEWPALGALIGRLVPSGQRPRFFGLQFTLLNLGIGIGGIIGGLFVSVEHPGTFVTIFLVDAATFLAPLAVMLGPLRHVDRDTTPQPASHEEGEHPSYRILLADKQLRVLLAVLFAASFVGYGQLNAGMPAYARADGGVSTRAIGFAYAANTILIVIVQLLVLKRLEGRRRTRVVMVMCGVWALAWVALAVAGVVSGGLVAAMLVIVCAGIFGLGETLYQPTLPAMLNDLSPDRLRGRYNAASQGAFQLASIIGPIYAGFLIGHGLGQWYVWSLVAGCAVLLLLVQRLERIVTPAVNGIPDS